MASEIDTKSSLTTELENLTALYAQSGLETVRTSCRTKSGFLVTHDRLPGFEPSIPSKTPSTSWIWKHGEALTKTELEKKYWMCRRCYQDSVHYPLTDYVLSADPTTLGIRHMKTYGFDKDSKPLLGKKCKYKDVSDGTSAQQQAQAAPFDREGWQRAMVQWSVSTRQSLRQTVHCDFRALLTFQNPRLALLVPQSPRN